MTTPSAAGRPAAATGSPGGVSRDSPETVAGRRRSGRHSPPFSGGERFSVRYRALATLPPQSFISSFNTLTAPPQPSHPRSHIHYPPIKKQTRHIRPISVSGTLRIRFCVHLPCAHMPVVLTPSVSHALAPVFRFTGTSRRISHLTGKEKNRGGFKPDVQFLLSHVFSWIGL